MGRIERTVEASVARGAELLEEGGEMIGRLREKAQGRNPLLVRKKFSMKDVYFRRDDPEAELFRMELGFDVEFWVVAIAALLLLMVFAAKMTGARKRARMRSEWRRGWKRKHKRD